MEKTCNLVENVQQSLHKLSWHQVWIISSAIFVVPSEQLNCCIFRCIIAGYCDSTSLWIMWLRITQSWNSISLPTSFWSFTDYTLFLRCPCSLGALCTKFDLTTSLNNPALSQVLTLCWSNDMNWVRTNSILRIFKTVYIR